MKSKEINISELESKIHSMSEDSGITVSRALTRGGGGGGGGGGGDIDVRRDRRDVGH